MLSECKSFDCRKLWEQLKKWITMQCSQKLFPLPSHLYSCGCYRLLSVMRWGGVKRSGLSVHHLAPLHFNLQAPMPSSFPLGIASTSTTDTLFGCMQLAFPHLNWRLEHLFFTLLLLGDASTRSSQSRHCERGPLSNHSRSSHALQQNKRTFVLALGMLGCL